ncbi:MAG: Holliday junction branch migration protein RuvA [Verrucomicrobia bacterium]|jgi:Holliday junction DNA helicase RuvA|nr:Holliday junction branch migration protein RuvA [Verrucomicrobiota bacterium]
MISFLEGTVEQAGPLSCVLNCNGVGYRVEIPVTTAEKLPAAGKTVRLHVQPVYREDHQALYGFASVEERDFFHLVTSRVSGIGPKIGLNLLSRLSFAMLRSAIASGDAALIAKCPGIGKKTAERVCIELKDKISLPGESAAAGKSTAADTDPPPAEGADSSFADAVQALMTLGFKLDAADKAVRKARGELGADAGADALIKAALRSG